MERIDFAALSAPLTDDDVEWRVMQCGKKGDRVWATLVPYPTARVIMHRLDEIVGPTRWQDEYREITTKHGAGVIGRLGIQIADGSWVWKEDGADSTDVEPTKGGISGALKRVAVKWGIGRELYTMPTFWATDVQNGYPPNNRTDVLSIYRKKDNIRAWCPIPKLPGEPDKTPLVASITKGLRILKDTKTDNFDVPPRVAKSLSAHLGITGVGELQQCNHGQLKEYLDYLRGKIKKEKAA